MGGTLQLGEGDRALGEANRLANERLSVGELDAFAQVAVAGAAYEFQPDAMELDLLYIDYIGAQTGSITISLTQTPEEAKDWTKPVVVASEPAVTLRRARIRIRNNVASISSLTVPISSIDFPGTFKMPIPIYLRNF